jgi:hypothetical protein
MAVAEQDVALIEGFAGEVLQPGDPAYDEVRRVHNGLIDKRPALIARCSGTADAVAAVNAAREHGWEVSVRGGGHNVAGTAVADGGLMIDLSTMKGIHVDPVARTVRAQGGVLWKELNRETQFHGLAVTGGAISTTGIAGLTLGGGLGWLMTKLGLAADNLLSVELVTADGSVLTVSADEHPDLFWGLRGGGGNFGVVVRFEFALHPVSTVLGGLMLFPLERGATVLRGFREWANDAPDAATMLIAILTAPPEPFVPPDLVGRKAVAIVGCWCGDIDEGTAALEPLRRLGPSADLFGPMPYPALQGMLDAGAPRGLRNYFRGGYVSDLSDDVIDVALDHGARMPSPMSALHVHQMGGAVARIGRDATAFSGRQAGYTYNVVSTWMDPSEDAMHIAANRACSSALAPLSEAGTYVNFLSDADGRGASAAYGDALYTRLARLKREYDPTNLFNRNQNVQPG